MTNQAGVSALIRDICRTQQVAVLMVAHDVNPILAYLDQVIYLARGGAVMGHPDEVITADTLTMLYGTPVDVLRDRAGRLVVVGQPDAPAARPHPGRAGSETALEPHLSWDLVADLRQMLATPSWSTRSGRHDRRRGGRRRSATSWCCAGRPSPGTPSP